MDSFLIFLLAECIVALACIVFNLVVFIAILRTPPLHTVNNLFIANLALGDIAVGIFAIPMAIISMGYYPIDFYPCLFIFSVTHQTTNVSVLMLVTVAADRFIAIKMPFFHHHIMTPRRAVYVNIFIWVLGCSLGLMPMVWNTGNTETGVCSFPAVMAYEFIIYFQFFGLMILPLLIMICIYIYIMCIVSHHAHHDSQIQIQLQQRQAPRRSTSSIEESRFKREVHAAKSFGVVLFGFTLCWLPLNIINVINFFCSSDCKTSYEAILTAIVMTHVNSGINPFLYALTNIPVKEAMCRILHRRRNKPNKPRAYL